MTNSCRRSKLWNINGMRTTRADVAGLISKVSTQEGAIVPAGNSMVEMVAQNRLEVRLGVEAADIDKLKLGQAGRYARLIAAGKNRMRPSAMTTLAILVLLPLALGIGQGAAMQQPLAIAIISGLAVQLPLVLVVLPSLLVFLRTPGSEGRGPSR